jgi:hypothetical protein
MLLELLLECEDRCGGEAIPPPGIQELSRDRLLAPAK